MSALRDRLQQSLGGRPGARLIPGSAGGELEIEVTASDLATAASTLAAERGVLLASYADDEGPGADGAGGGLRLRHIFAVEGDPGLVTVTATLDGKRPEAPSLTPMNPGAAWAEREMHDLFGIEFLGHPEPRPLLFSDARPEALPMRRDLARRELLRERVPDRGHLVTVEGEGVHALDLDFAGSTAPTESARARVSVHGERVVHVEPLLFRKHRGVEKGCEGRRPAAAVALAERACGRDAVANAAGMALALERLAGVRAPRRAAWLTTALLEIERIASHALALAAVVEACGSEACEMRLRRGHEAIRNALEAAFGSRLGLGVVAPGGVRRDLDAAAARALVKAVGQSAAELRAAVESALADRAFVDRLEGTGVAPPDLVAELGAQGPVARASGSRRDARRDHPSLAYPEISFWVPLYAPGDALARFRLRGEELRQSAAIAEETLANLPAGALTATAEPFALPPWGRSTSVIESPRGPVVQVVRADGSGRIARWHLRGASTSLWPLLPLAAVGGLVEDLPLLAASFDLCVACVDR